MPIEAENVTKQYDLDGGGNIDGGGYKKDAAAIETGSAHAALAEGAQLQEAGMSREYLLARRRVRLVSAFYAHALAYAVVNSLLLLIDVLTGSGLWFFWALFGWGIGLAFHAGLVWGIPHIAAWEEKMIAHELGRRTHV